MPVNDQTEINNVRKELGGISITNIPDADIDQALTEAIDETVQRTGYTQDTAPNPNLWIKIRRKIVVADMLSRQKGMEKQQDRLFIDIKNKSDLYASPDVTDPESETIITTAEKEGIQKYNPKESWFVNGTAHTISPFRRYSKDNDLDAWSRYGVFS